MLLSFADETSSKDPPAEDSSKLKLVKA